MKSLLWNLVTEINNSSVDAKRLGLIAGVFIALAAVVAVVAAQFFAGTKGIDIPPSAKDLLTWTIGTCAGAVAWARKSETESKGDQ